MGKMLDVANAELCELAITVIASLRTLGVDPGRATTVLAIAIGIQFKTVVKPDVTWERFWSECADVATAVEAKRSLIVKP